MKTLIDLGYIVKILLFSQNEFIFSKGGKHLRINIDTSEVTPYTNINGFVNQTSINMDELHAIKHEVERLQGLSIDIALLNAYLSRSGDLGFNDLYEACEDLRDSSFASRIFNVVYIKDTDLAVKEFIKIIQKKMIYEEIEQEEQDEFIKYLESWESRL